MRLSLFALLFVLCLSFVAAEYSDPRDGFSVSDRVQVMDTAVYSTGYLSVDGSSWSEFSLEGESFGDWVVGSAQSDVVPNGARYFAVFSCSWSGSWDCSETWQVLDRGARDGVDEGYDSSIDSLEGDFVALQALYESTNGDEWFDNQGWPEMTPQTMGDAVGIEVDGDGRVVRVDLQKVTTVDMPYGAEQSNGNNLRGFLPQEIGYLKRVQYFNVKQNRLRGSIPDSIGDMRDLEWLSLGGQRGDVTLNRAYTNSVDHRGEAGSKEFEETNEFSGVLPASLGNLPNIRVIEIRRQFLTGTLPPELGQATTLEGIWLNNQKGDAPLGGPLPPEWGNLSNLVHLGLQNHRSGRDRVDGFYGAYTGEVPLSWEQGLTNLAYIGLRGNDLEGAVPEFLASRDKRNVNFNNNRFSGSFPMGYFNGDNSNLASLMINDLNLSGSIPSTAPSPSYPRERDNYNLYILWTYRSGLEGSIPSWIEDMSSMVQFELWSNSFSGTFPTRLAEQPNIRLLMINNNDFSGSLPDVDFVSENYRTVYLQGNNFSGVIPASWESMIQSSNRLRYLILNDNELRGEIPSWVVDTRDADGERTLWRFRVHNNRFTFKDIIPSYEYIASALPDRSDYYYAPQKPFGESRSIEVASGGSFSIDFSDSVGYSGNEYVWLLDGEVVAETTEPVLTVADVSSSDAGVYVLRVTNPALEELTLFSKEVGVDVVDVVSGSSWSLADASYSGESLSVSAHTSSVRGTHFRPDGSQLFVLGRSSQNVVSYSLSVPWDLSSASYVSEYDFSGDLASSSVGSVAHGLYFREDGEKKWVFNRREIYEYTLSSPWDVSTAQNTGYADFSSFVSRGHDFDFSSDGEVLYIDDRNNQAVFEVHLSSPWDVSSYSLVYTLDISSEEDAVRGIQLSSDGSRMFLMDTGRREALEYHLSSPYDLSTASFVRSFSVSSEASNPRMITWRPNGEEFFVTGTSSARIYKYVA